MTKALERDIEALERDIRTELLKRISQEGHGLRFYETHIGVSAATLSRFLRGKGELTFSNAEKISAWLDGRELPRRREISSQRMRLGGKTFLITIEELSND